MNLEKQETVEAMEAGLEEVLSNFRSSVHAWSEAELARPRAFVVSGYRPRWRMAAIWALGSVMAVTSISAGLYRHQEMVERIARQQSAASSGQEATQVVASRTEDDILAPDRKMPDEKLMAAVDQEVSEEVPTAMEPLAELMDGNAGQ